MDRELPVYDILSLDQYLGLAVAEPQFNALLLGLFAGLAVLLTGVGLYGVVAYSVAQRTHEIGIRVALGARPDDVLELVVREGFKLTLLGVGIGIAASLGLTRFLATLLYGVRATDPLTLVAVSVILAAVALAACYVPARRATRVDPMVALRHE